MGLSKTVAYVRKRLPTYDDIRTAPYIGSSLVKSLAALNYA